MRNPSPQSLEIRQSLVRSTLRPGVTLEEQRREWEDHAASLPLAKGVTFEPEIIGDVPCAWLRNPDHQNDDVIIYFHGGGLVVGSMITHREMVSRLVNATGRSALLVDYRLVPETPFPGALDDATKVYHGLIEQHRVNPQQVILGGDSSGAVLVLSLLVRLRETQQPQPRCAFAISGSFDASLSGDSMHMRADLDPCLCIDELRDWQRHFKDDPGLESPELSPLFADLHGLPPILLQVGSDEVWFSDSARVAQKIEDAAGPLESQVWPGMWHVWPMWSALPETGETLTEIARFISQQPENLTA